MQDLLHKLTVNRVKITTKWEQSDQIGILSEKVALKYEQSFLKMDRVLLEHQQSFIKISAE